MILLLTLTFFPVQIGWPYASAGLVAGLYFFYRGFRLLQRRRLILDVPASKIRSASIGLVEVSGLAVGPYTMPAPLSGMPCYYYRAMAWQLKQSGKNSRWEKVADESLHLPFFLDDNTGRVLVDPQGAELDLHRDFRDEFDTPLLSSRLELPTNVASFLVRHGLSAAQKLKLEEYCIKPKNALFILGTLAPNPGIAVSATPIPAVPDDPIKFTFNLNLPDVLPSHASSSRSAGLSMGLSGTKDYDGEVYASPEIIRLPGNAPPSRSADMTQQEKVTAALIRAGISSPAAWAAAGVQMPGVAVTPAPAESNHPANAAGSATAAAPAPACEFDVNPSTVMMKGANDSSFFISWRSQREIVQSLGWKSTLMVWGGPALSLLSLYFLLQQFGLL